MKVLFIPDVHENGGAYKSLIEMIMILKNNFDVTPILLCSRDGKYTKFAKENNIEFHVAGYNEFYLFLGSTLTIRMVRCLLLPYYYFKYKITNYNALNIIKKRIDMNMVDIIHSNVNRNDIGALLAKKYSKPHVWHIREYGSYIKDFRNGYFFISLRNKYIDFMNMNTTRFLCVSKAVSKHWIKRGLDKNKINIVYNGISVSNNHIKIKRNTNTINIIMIGAISPQKGQWQLIGALKYLLPETLNKIHIDFYGDYRKSYQKKLKRSAAQLKMNNNIVFKGYDNDIYEKLYMYDIGVVATIAEGFGRAIVEYMMTGVGVISVDTGASKEIIESGKTGLLYKYGDVEELAKCIESFNDMKFRKNVTRRAMEEANEKFSSFQNAYNVYNIYQELVSFDV